MKPLCPSCWGIFVRIASLVWGSRPEVLKKALMANFSRKTSVGGTLKQSSKPRLGAPLRKKVMSLRPRLCSAQSRSLTPCFLRLGIHPMHPKERTVRPRASQKYLPRKGLRPHRLPVAPCILYNSFLTLLILILMWWFQFSFRSSQTPKYLTFSG